MRRKTLSPSVLRCCAVVVTLGSGLGWSGGIALGGTVATDRSCESFASQLLGENAAEQLDVFSSSPIMENISSANQTKAAVPAPSEKQVASDPLGPGLTGGNWFDQLQDRMGSDQSINSSEANVVPAKLPVNSNQTVRPVTAIPSIPSVWSGFTCCLGLIFLGMFPRIRRILR